MVTIVVYVNWPTGVNGMVSVEIEYTDYIIVRVQALNVCEDVRYSNINQQY